MTVNEDSVHSNWGILNQEENGDLYHEAGFLV